MKTKFSIPITLLIIILVITINYYSGLKPNNTENIQLDDENTVNVAVAYEKLAENVGLFPHTVSEEKIISLVELAEKEINQYCLDNQIETRFSFIPTPVIHKGGTSQGENPPGLDEMIQLNQSGINLIVGHDYSLANHYSLEYANEHKMLLLSPSGVGLGLSKPDDYLYKLSPNDYEDPEVYEKVYAQMIKALGYKAFITINTGRRSFYPNLVEETAKALNYSYRATLVEYDINADDLDLYLERAAGYLQDTIEVYGVENVCVLIEPLWIDDDAFLDSADKYPILSSVTWFDYIGLSEEWVVENGLYEILSDYGFTRLIMYPADTDRADVFYQKYVIEVGELPTPSRVYDEAARYDACWLMALSVLQANSSDPEDVIVVLPSVCESYEGVLGNCTLNEYGDRVSTDYKIYKWTEAGFEIQGSYSASKRGFSASGSFLTGETNIGVISPTNDDLDEYVWLSGLAEEQLNQICKESGMNTSFTFTVVSGEGSAAKALEYTQEFHETGIDLLIGGGWSSQLWVMRSYVNTRGVIVVSPSSTNPQEPMIQNDNIYRLTPHDYTYGKIMAHVAYDYGVEEMVILERDDLWAVGVGDWFKDQYEELGGKVIGRVKYPSATASEFSKYLDEVESLMDTQTTDTGIFLLSFNETSAILGELNAYPNLVNVTWFSTDKIANSINPNTIPESIASSIKLISPLPIPVWNEYSSSLARDYHDRFEGDLGFYEANIYDSCMILGLSVIQADSKNPSNVEKILPDVAEDYIGLTGSCGLDIYGDRIGFRTGLYAFGYLESNFRWLYIGEYLSPSNEIIWENLQ